MSIRRNLLIKSSPFILAIASIVIYAYEYGPDPGYSGAPGDNPTGCTASACHVGTPNSGPGSVKIVASGGTIYVPGQTQQIQVTVTDSSERKYGFELTARVDSNPKVMGAGTFTSTDGNTQVITCQSAAAMQIPPFAGSCPSGNTLQWIEHTLSGELRSAAPSTTYSFNWTPPATDVGPVTLYAAGNAGSGALIVSLTHTYLTSLQLSPAGGGSSPVITGVQNAGAFGALQSIAAGSWIEIYGSNLSPDTRGWAGSDFTGENAPTSLDGVKVMIDGRAAFVDYVNPQQVNVQVPDNVSIGPVPLIVSDAMGTSSPFTVTNGSYAAGLLAPPSFSIGGKQYVVAQFEDGTYVLPPGAIAGISSRQAKPGETIIIYGVGFGIAKNSSNQEILPGTIATQASQLATSLQLSFGGTAATLAYAGLAPNYVGLYQFNVVVPAVPNNDAVPLNFSLGGNSGAQTLYTAVHQ